MAERLDPETVGPYLADNGFVFADADVSAVPLGGGISNVVLRVTDGEDCVVVKQPLPELAVEDHWPADVSRVHNEAAAGRAWNRIVAANDRTDVRIPTVRFEDHEMHVVGIECAPVEGSWKAELLDGRVDRDVARTVGDVLGLVHREAATDDDLRAAFDDVTPFEQLRVDPYHRTTARRNPAVADAITDEAERVLSDRRTLVHGDYSPKNVLVDRRDGRTAWILDFEVAHWGAPSFDAGFVLNHLFIKSVYNAPDRAAYFAAVRALWDAYHDRTPWDVERETVAELGVLMLARVDGKSPVEYVTRESTREDLRTIARRILSGEAETIPGVIELVREVTDP